MKATEVLQLYEAGRRDFSGESLRGQSFKGKNLSDADFTKADIRSADFTNTNLTRAKFSQVKAGLCLYYLVVLLTGIWILAAVSGFFIAFIASPVEFAFTSTNIANRALGQVVLLVWLVYFVTTLFKGIVSGAFAVTVAGAFALIFFPAEAIAGAGSVAVAVAGVGAGSVAISAATAVAGPVAMIVTAIFTLVGAASNKGVLDNGIIFAITIISALLSIYIGCRAISTDDRDVWIRAFTIAFASVGSTSFCGAILLEADFSKAQLKNSDFRRAQLVRTHWRDARELNWVRPGDTYLKSLKVQELLITGNGQGGSFDYVLDLRGINLQGANLIGVDFTGSVLSDSNLQGANLTSASLISATLNRVNFQNAEFSNAKLVQAQLDQANLTGAILTGAYIADWNITTRTQLNGIRCDYVFMRLPPSGSLELNPRRKPDDWNKTFAEGEFSDFIAPMVETLDLYHNQAVDLRAVAISFHNLRQQYPDANLNIVSMEKRGKHREKLLLRAEASPQSDLPQLHRHYFEYHSYLLTLPSQALQALLLEKDREAQRLAHLLNTAIDQPAQTFISQYQNKGDITVSDQGSNASKYNLSNAQFASGFAGTVQGDQVGGTINNKTTETISLAEATAEIQNLLKQLEASNHMATEEEQTAYLSALIPPTKREQLIGLLKAAGSAAIEEVPYGTVLRALVKGWQRPNG